MKFNLKLASVVFMLVAVGSFAAAQDAKGWFDEDCSGATFHFTEIAGSNDGRSNSNDDQQLLFRLDTGNLRFYLYPAGPDWWDVQGKRCLAAGDCKDATDAKLQFQQRAKHRVSGRYVINLGGEHAEGMFMVKQRFHKHPRLICE